MAPRHHAAASNQKRCGAMKMNSMETKVEMALGTFT
jgi:hypothetical protein